MPQVKKKIPTKKAVNKVAKKEAEKDVEETPKVASQDVSLKASFSLKLGDVEHKFDINTNLHRALHPEAIRELENVLGRALEDQLHRPMRLYVREEVTKALSKMSPTQSSGNSNMTPQLPMMDFDDAEFEDDSPTGVLTG